MLSAESADFGLKLLQICFTKRQSLWAVKLY